MEISRLKSILSEFCDHGWHKQCLFLCWVIRSKPLRWMININSAKTGTRACKPSAVVSTDSPRAVKRDFCRTLLMTAGFIQPLICSLPNDQTKPIWKEQNESSARDSNTEFCDSGQCMLKLFSVLSSLVLSEQRIPNPPQSSPNRVPVWFPPATSQLFLPLLKIFSADMIANEHWVMVTVSCHQFCQCCAEIQWKKLKQSLWYSVEPDERDWYSCRHNVYKIRDLKAGALYFFLMLCTEWRRELNEKAERRQF